MKTEEAKLWVCAESEICPKDLSCYKQCTAKTVHKHKDGICYAKKFAALCPSCIPLTPKEEPKTEVCGKCLGEGVKGLDPVVEKVDLQGRHGLNYTVCTKCNGTGTLTSEIEEKRVELDGEVETGNSYTEIRQILEKLLYPNEKQDVTIGKIQRLIREREQSAVRKERERLIEELERHI